MEPHLHLICVFGVRNESFACVTIRRVVSCRRVSNAALPACSQQTSGTAVCPSLRARNNLHAPQIQPSSILSKLNPVPNVSLIRL